MRGYVIDDSTSVYRGWANLYGLILGGLRSDLYQIWIGN